MSLEKLTFIILQHIKESMQYKKVSTEAISPAVLGVTKEFYDNVVEMIYNDGYISGIELKKYYNGYISYNLEDAKITTKGIDYINENTTMKKIYNTIKGIKDIVK